MEIPSSKSLVKVLIVDRDASQREAFAGHLADSGYEPIEVSDGARALELMADEKPELILCELETANEYRESILPILAEEHIDVPIIVTSGAGSMSDVVEALRLGVSDFLITPIQDMVVLEHAIERSLERTSLRSENLKVRAQLEKANTELKNNLAVLEQDQQAGLQVQMKMLPVSPLQKAAYVFQHQIVPSLYLSGDFVEYVAVGSDHMVFFVADVSGHGASSAFVTVLLKNLTARLRSDYNHHGRETVLFPAQFLEQANAELLATGIGKHATLFYAVMNIRTNELRYASAGQLPLPILISQEKTVYLEGEGAPVGLFEDNIYEEVSLTLPKQFRLMVFSDGILEIIDQPTLREKEQYLLENVSATKTEIEAVLNSLDVDLEKHYPDDVALLMIDKH